MRALRIIVPPNMDGLYHVVSRVVDRRMVFGEEEKRRFRELLGAGSNSERLKHSQKLKR